MLRPEAEGDAADQLFLLTPAVIQKEDIQVKKNYYCRRVCGFPRSPPSLSLSCRWTENRWQTRLRFLQVKG